MMAARSVTDLSKICIRYQGTFTPTPSTRAGPGRSAVDALLGAMAADGQVWAQALRTPPPAAVTLRTPLTAFLGHGAAAADTAAYFANPKSLLDLT